MIDSHSNHFNIIDKSFFLSQRNRTLDASLGIFFRYFSQKSAQMNKNKQKNTKIADWHFFQNYGFLYPFFSALTSINLFKDFTTKLKYSNQRAICGNSTNTHEYTQGDAGHIEIEMQRTTNTLKTFNTRLI